MPSNRPRNYLGPAPHPTTRSGGSRSAPSAGLDPLQPQPLFQHLDLQVRPLRSALQLNNLLGFGGGGSGGSAAHKKSDIGAALKRFSRAVELSPDDPDAILGTGKTQVTMRQPEKALPYLEPAVKLEPFDATIRYRLASVYRELCRMADSRREHAAFQRLRKMKDALK